MQVWVFRRLMETSTLDLQKPSWSKALDSKVWTCVATHSFKKLREPHATGVMFCCPLCCIVWSWMTLFSTCCVSEHYKRILLSLKLEQGLYLLQCPLTNITPTLFLVLVCMVKPGNEANGTHNYNDSLACCHAHKFNVIDVNFTTRDRHTCSIHS